MRPAYSKYMEYTNHSEKKHGTSCYHYQQHKEHGNAGEGSALGALSSFDKEHQML